MLLKLFKKLDIFTNGYLTYTQFISSIVNFDSFFTRERVWPVFKIIDIDNDCKVSMNDLYRFVTIQFQFNKDVSLDF